jgi:hypothetical protein
MDSPRYSVEETESGAIVLIAIPLLTPNGVEHNFHIEEISFMLIQIYVPFFSKKKTQL